MENAQYGTEKDGNKSAHCCRFCCDWGKFTADIIMQQLINFCAKPIADATGINVQQTKMAACFPKLKRRQYQTLLGGLECTTQMQSLYYLLKMA